MPAPSPASRPTRLCGVEVWHGRSDAVINAEERANSIRGIAIVAGDIDTPSLEKASCRPPEARRNMLTACGIADCVMLAINLPSRAVIEQQVIQPRY